MALLLTPENLLGKDYKGKRGPALRRYRNLENDRSSWRSHWQEISDYILPRRGKYLIESQNSRGRKRTSKIIDSSATQALRTMAAGMMSGMTSPSRPWFRFTSSDRTLMENYEVQQWLSDIETIIRAILQRSNFYTSMHTVYEELGGFGTAPLYRQRNFNSVIRFRPFTAGEYVIAENDEGVVDTVGRHFAMTVAQVVRKFVHQPEGSMDWKGASTATKRLWEQQNYDALVPVLHIIQPRPLAERNPSARDQTNMPFSSVYFEYGGDGDDLLFEGGFKRLPVYVPRWDVRPGDIYGQSPGMETLPDVKQLQHQQKRLAQAIDKMVNPPMVASVQLRGKPTSVLPGSNTYVDPSQGSQGFTPAYMVQPRVNEMMMSIQEVQERIQRGFFADLFAMMINSDRRQITATEVAERHDEKLVLLGPVLQRVNTELLDPVLDDVFEFAMEAGLLPEPPSALQGSEIDVEYISLLAQAQQAVSSASIERTLSFAGNLAAVFPNITDIIDADEALRQYADSLGNDPAILRDAAAVDKMRGERQASQERQTALENATQGAQAAKVLSEADTQNPNALTSLIGGQSV
ncbi:MAG: portal protein [Actinomycetota bacterium]|nr:portal protein [Actinomycetota bacterium]